MGGLRHAGVMALQRADLVAFSCLNMYYGLPQIRKQTLERKEHIGHFLLFKMSFLAVQQNAGHGQGQNPFLW